jgi:hypothetical protein
MSEIDLNDALRRCADMTAKPGGGHGRNLSDNDRESVRVVLEGHADLVAWLDDAKVQLDCGRSIESGACRGCRECLRVQLGAAAGQLAASQARAAALVEALEFLGIGTCEPDNDTYSWCFCQPRPGGLPEGEHDEGCMKARAALALDNARCGAFKERAQCDRPKGHDGLHADSTLGWWYRQCEATLNGTRCELDAGHPSHHRHGEAPTVGGSVLWDEPKAGGSGQ